MNGITDETTPKTRSRRPMRMTAGLFVAAAATLTFSVAAGGLRLSSGDWHRPDSSRMALAALGREPTDDVVAFWRTRVAQEPETAEFHTSLANALLRSASEVGDQEQYLEAEQVARTAVSLAVRFATGNQAAVDGARLALAASLASQHAFTEAREQAESVLGDNPESLAATIVVADTSIELGDYDRAAELSNEIRSRAGDAPSVVSRQARASALNGDLDRSLSLARAALTEAAELDLTTFEGAFYWFQVATYEFQTGRYDDAESSLRDALTVEPRHLGARELMGQVLIAQGRYDAAIVWYEPLVEELGAADLHGHLADLYEHVGRAGEAAEQRKLGLAVARESGVSVAAERRHLVGFLADVDPAFAEELASADLAERQDVHSYAWLAWTQLRNARPEEALTTLQPALRLGTNDAWLLYQAGSIYAANNQLERADELLSAALELSPQFDLVHAAEARRLLASLDGR